MESLFAMIIMGSISLGSAVADSVQAVYENVEIDVTAMTFEQLSRLDFERGEYQLVLESESNQKMDSIFTELKQ